MKKTTTLALAAAGALALPTAAQAHISLHPNTTPTGAFATLDVRVPNEEDKPNTIKVDMQVPPGFLDASTGYLPGWTVEVKTRKLAKPVTTPNGTVDTEVAEIVWTGDGKQGKIPPHSFLNFPISVKIPGKAGDALTFKTVQSYDDGKVARWIGPPSADMPAPTINVTPAGGALQDVAGDEAGPKSGQQASGGAAVPSRSQSSTAAASTKSGGGASKGLTIAALVLGALGLIAGSAGLALARRARGGEVAASS